MRKLKHPRLDEMNLAEVLYALGDPARLQIVTSLAELSPKIAHERSCKSVCQSLRLSKSTLSHHFKILREAGLIRCDKEGTQYVNHLRHEDLQKRFPQLLNCILKAYKK